MEPLPLPPPLKAGLNWGQLVVVVLLCVVSVLIGLTLPYARNASNTSDDLARSTEISGCRAAANADVIDARTNVDSVNVELNLLDNRFNDALLNANQAEADAIRPLGAPLRKELEAVTADYRAKNDAYQDAVRLSVDDPDTFLSRCRRNELIPATTSTTTPRLTGAVGEPTTTTTDGRPPRRTTTTTRPSTTTTGSTTTTTYRSSPTPSAPCIVPIPLELPCL